MKTEFIEFDQMRFKGVSVGFSFKVELDFSYSEKDWLVDRIYIAKEAVSSIEAGDEVGWVRIDDDADFQWIIPTIEEHIGDNLRLAEEARELLWDRKQRAA